MFQDLKFVKIALFCTALIESELSWNVILHLFLVFFSFFLWVYLWFFVSHTLCFWKVNNNKIHFSSLILTRTVSVWFLFISITYHTSVTLRSGGGRGVKMTHVRTHIFFTLSFTERKSHRSRFALVPALSLSVPFFFCYFAPLAWIVHFFHSSNLWVSSSITKMKST